MKYTVQFIDGHDLRYKTFSCIAKNQQEAIEKMFDAYGSNFDHYVIDVYRKDD